MFWLFYFIKISQIYFPVCYLKTFYYMPCSFENSFEKLLYWHSWCIIWLRSPVTVTWRLRCKGCKTGNSFWRHDNDSIHHDLINEVFRLIL